MGKRIMFIPGGLCTYPVDTVTSQELQNNIAGTLEQGEKALHAD